MFGCVELLEKEEHFIVRNVFIKLGYQENDLSLANDTLNLYIIVYLCNKRKCHIVKLPVETI